MSNDYWIKLKEQTQELLLHDVDAYLVMSLVMFKARENQKYCKYQRKKLPPGCAFVDDYSCLKMSRQRWRDAKERIHTVHQLATHKGTNKGTLFTLLNTEFCDLNIDAEEPSKEPSENQQGTNKEPPALVNVDEDILYKNKEQRHACSAGYKIVSLLDGWKHLEKPSDYVHQCMLCYVDLPATAEKAVATLQKLNLSDEDIYQLSCNPKITVERILLACIFVRWKIEKQEEITNLPGLLVWHCKEPDSGLKPFPMPPPKKDQEEDENDDVNEFLAQKYANEN